MSDNNDPPSDKRMPLWVGEESAMDLFMDAATAPPSVPLSTLGAVGRGPTYTPPDARSCRAHFTWVLTSKLPLRIGEVCVFRRIPPDATQVCDMPGCAKYRRPVEFVFHRQDRPDRVRPAFK